MLPLDTPRLAGPVILNFAQTFPSIVLTGPRRAGKTYLLRQILPDAQYLLLEDPDVQQRFSEDPRGLIENLKPPVIFDEVQNTPKLFNYIRSIIDHNPRQKGQWFFTGSQEASLMRGVTESMAGRAGILQLLPMSAAESPLVSIVHGGFPEVLADPGTRDIWMASYLRTYLERDVRAITNIKDLGIFRRFMSLLAARHGQELRLAPMAAPLGVSIPTLSNWVDILAVTGQLILVQPYFENFGKRIIKSPRVYFSDSGMACYLLGIRNDEELDRSPFLGAIFEGHLVSEIAKSQTNGGRAIEIYYFRDQRGFEVDLIVPWPDGAWLIEAKAGHTVFPEMAKNPLKLSKAMGTRSGRVMVVHRKSKTGTDQTVLAPGAEAIDSERFVEQLNDYQRPAIKPTVASRL